MGVSILSAALVWSSGNKRDYVGETTLKIYCQGNYSASADRTDYETYYVIHRYSSFTFNWNYRGSSVLTSLSGNCIISGLNKASSNTVYLSLTISYWDDYEYISREDGSIILKGGGQRTTQPYQSNELTVWTRPGKFDKYNFSKDTIIQSSNGLTAAKVSDWITHCNNFSHWYNQSSQNTTTSTCQATSGAVITAAWYNACVSACADKSKITTQTATTNQTIITADIIKKLGEAISKDGEVS